MAKAAGTQKTASYPKIEEVEAALRALVAEPFDPKTFPLQFLAAFGEREDSLKRIQRDNKEMDSLPWDFIKKGAIHIRVTKEGEDVEEALRKIHPTDTVLPLEKARSHRRKNRHKVQFLLATDGRRFAAADLTYGTRDSGLYKDLPDCMGIGDKKNEITNRSVFFGSLVGIRFTSNPVPRSLNDYAAKQLNQLYLQLRKSNPGQDLTHFMAQLIFCFFAQNIGIFYGKKMFTTALRGQARERAEDYRPHMEQLFRVFDIPENKRTAANTPEWTKRFPYVNGNLFSGAVSCPDFDTTAYKYLDWAGETSWRDIDPDIFGTMIQAMAGPEKRGELGSHYTSVENILRVLNPLFLDDLRETLEDAGKSRQKLNALKERLSRIRIFDPACGSGNFLVIAYKELRAIQNEIDTRLGIEQPDRRSVLHLGNFHGIEIESFCTEIARLALIVAEFQCNEIYITQQEALNELLPLEDTHKAIKCGNALRMDWQEVCPPGEGSETYICGNPPYKGSHSGQTQDQKQDLEQVFKNETKKYKDFDYIAGWFMKAVQYGQNIPSKAAFVSTNSICQGSQVALLWPLIFDSGYEINFAHNSFKWKNNASHNAGVIVSVIGLSPASSQPKILFTTDRMGNAVRQTVRNINAYLVPGQNIIVTSTARSPAGLSAMTWGNMPNDGGHLLLTEDEKTRLLSEAPEAAPFVKCFFGSKEIIQGIQRYCLWICEKDKELSLSIPFLKGKFKHVENHRVKSTRKSTKKLADYPYRFGEVRQKGDEVSIVIPGASSGRRPYLPVDFLDKNCIVGNSAFAIYDAPLWNLALIASRLHLVWIAAVCGKIKTDFRYSNTLGWNTFPVPKLTKTDKAELTESAKRILLARERHFPATLADLYKDEAMPDDLREAHAQNDELVERIFAGKVFRNNTERLETLFDLYSKMVARQEAKSAKKTSPKTRARKPRKTGA